MQSTIAGIVRAAALLVVAALAGCGVGSQEAPSLIGPSGFSQSVSLSASPDRLPRDGTSQAVITVTVRNESGRPVSGQRVTLTTTGGTLSQSDVVTGSDGRATSILTAPPSGSTGNVVQVFATPTSENFDNAVTRALTIALIGASNTTAPTPSFTITPEDPEIQEIVTFDASATTDEGAACTSTCSFAWRFSDGASMSGPIVSRTFSTAGSYTATLTVTDAAGSSASTTQNLSVSDVAAPTVSAPTVSPSPAIADQPAVFTASATAASGHRIVQYAWNFGDGTTATTTEPSISKIYTVPGTYTVTSTATDDLGRSGRAVVSVTVSNPTPNPPVARFTFTPSQPRVGQDVVFDASASTAGNRAVIRTYRWDYGDGTVETTTTPTISHRYDEARTYAVVLIVTDDRGQTSQLGRQVTVVP